MSLQLEIPRRDARLQQFYYKVVNVIHRILVSRLTWITLYEWWELMSTKQKYQNYFYMLYANYLTYIIPKSISESGIHKTAMDLRKPWIIILITKSCKTARKDIFLVAWLKLVVSILNSIQYLGKVGLWYRSNPWGKWTNRAMVLLCIQIESSVLAMTGCISGTGH